MNIVALSPHFPDNFVLFWLRLSQAGAKVLGVADVPYEELKPELRDALTEYWRVDDLHDIDEVEHACRELQKRHGRLQRLESQNEYWLELEAELRTRLDITGPKLDTISQLKRKSQMQELYQQAEIPIPPGTLATSYQSCHNLAVKAGYPLVAKPDIGVGAAQTYKINSEQELEDFWQHKPDVDYFLQGFVGGELYSFDGMADADGKIVFAASHHFCNGIMEIVNQDLDLMYYSLREIPQDLWDMGQRAVQVFDVRERFFHFEFFLRPDNSWCALEVNIRPPGGWTTDMMNYANDVDVYQGFADLLMKGDPQFEAHRPFHAVYVGRKERHYVLSHDEIMARYGESIVKHSVMPDVFKPVMGVYGYLLRDPDLGRAQQMAREIQEVST